MLGNANPCPTIGVKDLAAARDFYENMLGLSEVLVDNKQAQLVVYKNGNGALQLYQTSFAGTNKATYLTWEVTGIDDIVKTLDEKGVPFEDYPPLGGPDSVDGYIHNMGDEKAAWFKDPDGNILCLHQSNG